VKVKLTYFKSWGGGVGNLGGKYYSEGEYNSESEAHFKVIEEVVALREAGKLPGLSEKGTPDHQWHILIITEPDSVPHLLPCPQHVNPEPDHRAFLEHAARIARDSARPIQQEWTTCLGLRHQGVLMAAVRGCDTAGKNDATKTLTRFYRAAVLNAHCGDPTKAQSFIEVPPDDPGNKSFHAAVKGFFAEMDALPNHYVMHFLHAAEIVGYYHPEVESRVTGVKGGTLHRQPLPDSEAASLRKAVEAGLRWSSPDWFEAWETSGTRKLWADFYAKACRKLHINPETKEQLDARLNADEDAFGKVHRDQ
jgi:hypothetical protein